MTFLAPWILAALPAALIPVVIHLLNRGRPRPIHWAAMQMLLESVRKNQRRLQLRDLILLILRILVVAVLVFLFARFALWAPAGSAGLVPTPVSAMLVLDVSASMGQSDGRTSRLESAREAALKLLDKISADSVCGVILATDRAVPLVPRPSSNLELVRDQLAAAQGTFSATDLFPAIERAFQELSRSQGADKIVFVLTDSQKSAWRESQPIRELAAKFPGIELRSVAIGGAGEPNTAITGLAVQPSMPVIGRPSDVRVDVTNLTENPLEGVRVTIAANREQPQDEATLPAIPPGDTVSASLKMTFDRPGLHTIKAEIPRDLFPADNIRSAAVPVANPRQFLIVSLPMPGDQRNTPAFFLQTALEATQNGGDIRTIAPPALTAETLDAAEVVFVASPLALGDSQWATLESFAKSGHGVVVFPESGSSGNLGSTPPTQWLPGTLGARLPGSATWVQAGLSHPVTAGWADASRTRLTNISSDLRFELQPQEGALPLAADSRGGTIAVSGRVGEGSAVLFASPPVPSATKLVLHPFFPILMSALVNYLSPGQAAAQTLSPGQSFSTSVEPAWVGKKIFLESDRDASRAEVGVVAGEGALGIIRIPAVRHPGGYLVFVDGLDAPVASFAVSLDPTESVLATVEAIQFKAEAPAAGSVASSSSAPRVPRETWMFFAFLLLALAVTELVLAYRFTVTR